MVSVHRTVDGWLVEVQGEVIGRADTACEADALAKFWRGRMECVARRRLMDQRERSHLPDSLKHLLGAERT